MDYTTIQHPRTGEVYAVHTPGPWQSDELGIIYSGDCAELCDHHSNEHIVAILKGARPEDARLIAAAPLMLEALREAHSFIAEHYEWWTDGTDEHTTEVDIFESITAAIAAATGEDA